MRRADVLGIMAAQLAAAYGPHGYFRGKADTAAICVEEAEALLREAERVSPVVTDADRDRVRAMWEEKHR